ncbi:hypothetical protein CW304_18555 [Bacillus sp. UFRGS-B20]|nr:hypothetical protein CW304_18555 [Bacillus sp. UFRGS-B20]
MKRAVHHSHMRIPTTLTIKHLGCGSCYNPPLQHHQVFVCQSRCIQVKLELLVTGIAPACSKTRRLAALCAVRLVHLKHHHPAYPS